MIRIKIVIGFLAFLIGILSGAGFAPSSWALEVSKLVIINEGTKSNPYWRETYGPSLIPISEEVADYLNGLEPQKEYSCKVKAFGAGFSEMIVIYNLTDCKEK